jgi:flavin-dependent dehydrogenase
MDAIIPEAVDVVVVGARCAGAATAMLLSRAGRTVLLVDRGEYGTDILSTHALMRGAVLQLARWNVLGRIVDAGTPPVKVTTFHVGAETVRVPIKPKFGVDALYAPRRTVLDRALVDAARESGAIVRFGTRLTALSQARDGRVDGVVLRDRTERMVQVRA